MENGESQRKLPTESSGQKASFAPRACLSLLGYPLSRRRMRRLNGPRRRSRCAPFVSFSSLQRREGLEQDAVERLLESYGLRPHLSQRARLRVRQCPPRSTTGLNSSGDTKPPGPCFGHWASWPNSASRLSFATWNSPQERDRKDSLRVHRRLKTSSDRRHSRSGRSDLQVPLGCEKRPDQRAADTGSLDPGVTEERHYALNWLIGYMEQAWDDVSTST